MQMIRRRFLQLGGAVAAYGLSSPIWMRKGPLASVADAAVTPTPSARKLLILLLEGGNDGLNTVVPYAHSDYYARRPTIAVPPHQVLALPGSQEVGLHPNLKQLHGLFAEGQVAIVQGVGYDRPELSHGASMDVWQSGNPKRDTGTGWIGRYLDLTPDHSSVIRAVGIGTNLPRALVGDAKSGVEIPSLGGFAFYDGSDKDPKSEAYRLHQAFLRSATPDRTPDDSTVDAVLRADRATVAAQRAVSSLASAQMPAPQSAADRVSIAMRLLSSPLGVDAAFVTLGGFDNHAAEQGTHASLLAQLDAAIGRFDQDVSRTAHPESYLMLTFSEFGRRVEENGSRGTDHGTAAPVFVVGRRVQGGLYGAQPGLNRAALDPNANLVRAVDFREVYATILDHWLPGASARAVLATTAADGLHPVPFLRSS